MSERDRPCCCICGAADDLVIAPLMTGDRFGENPRWPVCKVCYAAWYESGRTTAPRRALGAAAEVLARLDGGRDE